MAARYFVALSGIKGNRSSFLHDNCYYHVRILGSFEGFRKFGV